MKEFLIALQFLTIIPVGSKSAIDKSKLSLAVVYFPIVGLFLGLILAAGNKLLSFIPMEGLLANTILVILLIVLTGGLHLDGLADTFDAFLSRKDKSEMLRIMRDSHIGAMGVLSLICIILLKLSLLCCLTPGDINVSLILMCLLGRYSLVLAIFLFPYAREEGKAKVFIEGKNWKSFSLATVISLLCALILSGLTGLIVFMLVALFAAIAGKFITKQIGGMTGDTLGAINELSEVFVLLSMLILSRSCAFCIW